MLASPSPLVGEGARRADEGGAVDRPTPAASASCRSASHGFAAVAMGVVVVDQPHRLHEGVARRRPDEAEAALAQILAQRDRGCRLRGQRAADGRRRQRRRLEAPDVGGEAAELLLDLERPLGIVDRRVDLAAMADDAGVLQQPLDIGSPSSSTPSTGSKFLNCFRNCGRFLRMVSQLSPDWKPSRQSFSNSRLSSVTGRPHSSSW